MTEIIRAEELIKTYLMGQVEVNALRGVSFEIHENEFVAIMGPSGSGKSTLMNLVGCLDTPTSGQLVVSGQDVNDLSDRQLAQLRGETVGFVFQTFNLIPRITALNNVLLPMGFVGTISRNERQAQAEHMLERVGLGHRTGHMPTELSGGERQRVAIARALANNPRLILADEPTGNLDTKTGGAILDLFDDLHDEGRTLVMVTHDPDVAERAERRIHIVDGEIQANEEAVTHGVS
ncbi:MAG: ABC transporter ATP-binding protein [Candidatus Bipolaricaulia bacterium]